jgi:hypothetical protein
MNKR